jgi:ceramide synthetase
MIHGTKIELKYWEYLLHHFLAVSLLYFSTMYNCEMIGVVVLILHDISDIFLSVGRVYGDCGKKKLLVYFWYSSILISWIYTRVYVFPVKIWDCILNHH